MSTDGTWDLSSLYQRFDDPAHQQGTDKLAALVDRYIAHVNEIAASAATSADASSDTETSKTHDVAPAAFDAAALADLLAQEEQMWVLGADLQKFADLSQAADASDKQAARSQSTLKKIYARMQSCAGTAWADQRNILVSFAHVPYENGSATLTELRNLARTGTATERKAAFDAEIACSQLIEQGMAFSLNGIKEQENLEADLRGYASVLDMTMAQSHMRRETLDALWKAMENHLPLFHRYLAKKSRLLGYESGLPWHELHAPLGSSHLTFTVDEARTYLVKHLGAFAPDLGTLVERAFEERWIDLYPRLGKSGGAFCRNLTNQRQSRVLTNFDGSLQSVTTIAHELGHAYHGQQIEDHRPLNRTYTMPVAETASNFNETLVMNAAIAEAHGAERLMLVEQRLQGCTQTVCDIYSRFLFEQELFERRRSGFLFPDQLCDIMSGAQKRACGNSLDPKHLHPYMWVNKVHYYSPTLGYYNFPYAFGLLLALGLYARYIEEGPAFAEKYRLMLNRTTVCTVEEAAAVTGEDMTSVTFWNRGLRVIAQLVEEFVETA